ncbi:zinc-dependent alcohol dehydrogenase family protein [Aliivibrio fischeri]|nr:zinc-dependent alcohol dehydrogenase family protein [Aliivibrio fischeri]
MVLHAHYATHKTLFTNILNSMRAIIQQFGPALESVQLEPYSPSEPLINELQVKMKFSTINPSDLITISGAYRSRITLPFVPGFEGIGKVTKCSDSTSIFSIGDRVLPIGTAGAWQKYRNTKEDWCFTIPENLSDEQAATSYINPMTAWLMLTEALNIHSDMSIIVNAANSAIGLMLIRMLNHLGITPIALVRRDNTIEEFENCRVHTIINTSNNADYQKLLDITKDNKIDAVLDCIGGDDALLYTHIVKEHAQFINYGLLSKQPIPADFWIQRPDIQFSYFHLRQWIHSAEKPLIQNKLNEVMNLVHQGIADTKIDRYFSLKEIHHAIQYIEKTRTVNKGKVLITF